MSPIEFPTARLSTRVSLRWIPEPAFENTDTIVLSVGEWYVDLRMDKRTGTIDWAIAGERIVESNEPAKVLFTHELDSHGEFSSSDLGTFSKLPTGDDLETGSMPRPDVSGAPITEYEEVWRELEPNQAPESDADKPQSWIVESVDEQDGNGAGAEEKRVVKTFLGRIASTYVALRQEQIHKWEITEDGKRKVTKTGGPAVARREEWEKGANREPGKWSVKYVVGDESNSLPALSMQADGKFQGEGTDKWKKGGIVDVNGEKYRVRAFEYGRRV
ncbi:hypothetical protein Plec18167_001093 [Paecilomyces lecythidis]|uniref:Protein HRI1 n=1 Tax=Paecilomyces lecythidis TaxID=3004212 RepID=A0ABR3YCS6_9EURO